jgi:hypothetical protein
VPEVSREGCDQMGWVSWGDGVAKSGEKIGTSLDKCPRTCLVFITFPHLMKP